MEYQQLVGVALLDMLSEHHLHACKKLYDCYHDAQAAEYTENLEGAVDRACRVARARGQLVIPCSYLPEGRAKRGRRHGRGVALIVADRDRVHILDPLGDFPTSALAQQAPPRVKITRTEAGGRRWSAMVLHAYEASDANSAKHRQCAEQYSKHVIMAMALGQVLQSGDFVEGARALERAGIPGVTSATLPGLCERFARTLATALG